MNYKNAGQDAELDSDTFRRVCQFALVNTSINVMKESAATVGHAERVAYAKRILSGDISMTPVMYVVLADPTILALNRATAATDAQVQAAIDAAFNILAGVST